MAFKTWSVGDVLTASDVNTYLGKQSVIVCTSGTRPSAPVEGMTIYETDTDSYKVYGGASWLTAVDMTTTSYAPAWTGSSTDPSLGDGTISGLYQVIGESVHLTIIVTMGSTTTYGTGRWLFSLPVAAAAETVGVAYAEDSSASVRYPGSALISGSSVNSIPMGAGGTAGASATVPITWATGDKLAIAASYRR